MIAQLLANLRSKLTADVDRFKASGMNVMDHRELDVIRGRYHASVEILEMIEKGLKEPEGFDEE